MQNFHVMPAGEAKVEHQVQLEKLFNKNQLIPRIRREFQECEAVDFLGWFQAAQIPEKFGYDVLTQMALHKRCNMATLVGVLRHHGEDAQEVADLILKACVADLLHWDPNTRMFVVEFTISADAQAEIDKYQFPLPMVVKPRELKSNMDSGYLTSRGSVILKDNHHNEDVVLSHLNRVNGVKFCINHITARVIKNSWKNLDKPKEGETKEDFQKRVKAFEKYDRTSHEVIDHLLMFGNEFYLTHKYDKRGRIYCQGYHVNYQGAPWNKAVIELADAELVS